MAKGIFSNDDIHAIGQEMAERWSHMTPEEARADLARIAAEEQAAIEMTRGMTKEQIAAIEAACWAAYEDEQRRAE